MFTMPSSVTSTLPTTGTTNAILAAVPNGLTVMPYDTNTFYIAGIIDTNLIPGRSFTLNFVGWNALDTLVGAAAGSSS